MPDPSTRSIAVIGGGPAGLIAAELLSAAGLGVTVYDRMPTLGRKLLMAGRGGLNLTHSEPLQRFLARYSDRQAALAPSIAALTPDAVRAWCESMGEATFVGTSGRVFPKSMKASPLLRAWLRRLASQGVAVETRHRWLGWNPAGHLRFDTPAGGKTIAADATILALGGASWPRLGADGSWTTILEHDGITITPLAPANCGFRIAWSEHLRSKFAGTPLKRLALSHAGEWIMGEALITRDGIEGGAVYALSSRLRKAIAADGTTTLLIDLRPDVSLDALSAKLSGPRGKQSLASHLRKAGGLPPVAIALLHETALATATPLAALDPAALATAIKSTPLRLLAPFSLDRAISTAGGVDFAEINDDFMLRRRPGVFVAGEMLDWDAPTGGYLLQACLATGAAAARGVLHRLDQ